MLADVAILGGGCAGLSLAMRLAGTGVRTVVLEAREHYVDDRTWCFWDDGSGPLAHLVAHSWPTVTVGGVALRCDATPYRMLPARVLYGAARARIDGSANVTLVQPARVRADPAKVGAAWRIDTDAGVHTATHVIDTRPRAKPSRDGAVLWQSFVGREVECPQARFDPERAVLMEFAPPAPDRVAFTYVLPTSPTRALIEWTVFGPDPLPADAMAADLDAAVAARTGGAHTVLRTEAGILPMGMARPPPATDPTHTRAGLFAGGARPSTGYAFQRIQRWADACARALVEGRPPCPHPPDPPLLRAMDSILLAVIRADPAAAPALFTRLFARADTGRVIRFLSDRGSFADYVAISWALPKPPFIRRLPNAVANRHRLAA